MNKEEINHHINDIPIPEDRLIQREKTAMLQAKKNQYRRKKTIKYSSLIACGICVSLLGFGFISPTMAKTLSGVPVIGSIYAQFNDIASDKIEKDELATSIERRDSHSGLTMNVKEAVYDGGRLVVTVEYKGENPISKSNEEKAGFSYITINGKEVRAAIGSTSQKSKGQNTIIEQHEFTLANYGEFGDKIDVSVHGKDLFEQTGTWNVAFPLTKVEGEIHKFTPNIKTLTKDNLYALTVNQVTFSSLSTRIDLTFDYPKEMEANDSWPALDYTVTDDKGKIYEGVSLQVGSTGLYGHHIVLALPPMDNPPKSLTIEPTYFSGLNDTLKNGGAEDLKTTVLLQ
ncbi:MULTISPECIES: DUF4179 domain-containing protein [Bacillus cereus group]|uniref:DUF4179 domain-containing protein n=1 Tax=Bacillus thuringiensis TaxID=1428 RepID=A0A1C4GCA2_BACTU|nr:MULTISPECIES: DUF4179 domain-containing protein [Bacillus cereus group]MCC2327733.1 DUF4179 domain-containing protein [Bacillus wiedmannii]MDP1460069.1 DUF4179 domain-containing protein [Bacillus wiedmannii]MED2014523.1 DUF4179 domain-containing protein [Bacillus wiedmannii]MED3021366.1 DUF4179 domain-containing protein [Bacillus wiedmannii]OTX98015.1 hypothetical protein BK729_15110 [Bacillus thuringiensis serovar wratislaviensis]